MGKNWIKPISIFLGLLLALGTGARFVAGKIIGSSQFRDITVRFIERGIGHILPGVMVEVDGVSLAGFAGIDIRNVLIRSGSKADLSVLIPYVGLRLNLGAVVSSGVLLTEVEVTLPEKGYMASQVAAPLSWFLGRNVKSTRYEPFLAVEGSLMGVPVAPFYDLFMVGLNGPSVQLKGGVMTGRFTLRKPIGSARSSGQKSGRMDFQVLSPTWSLAESLSERRELQLANLDVSLDLQDFTIGLRHPLIFQDKKERAIVTGALGLPKYAEDGVSWNVIVQAEGSPRLQDILARMVRCRELPVKPTFSVKGPWSAPFCRS